MQQAAYPYQLKLLSGFWFGLCGPDGAIEIDVPGQKSRALLCILALDPVRPLSRTYLGGLLWETMPAEQAAMNLRQTLSVIKRALGDHYNVVMAVTKQTIAFHAEAVVIDAHAPGLIDDTPPLSLKLFGHLGVRSRSFEVWLNDQQNKVIHNTALRARRAFGKAVETHQYQTALKLAQRLVTLEPDNEVNVRHVYDQLKAVGQNHQAILWAKDHPTIDFDPINNTSPPSLDTDEAVSPIIMIGRFNRKADDKAAAAIALALSEAVVGDLAESAWVRVTAPDLINLSSPIFGLATNLPTGVPWNYRLDGAIQSSPLAVSVWLTSGADQTVVWTEKFTATSIGGLADHIVSRVTGSLESVVLDAEGKRSTRARTIAGYWEELARARLLIWRATMSSIMEAEVLLDRMLEDAPHDVRVLTLASYAKLINAWSAWQGSTAGNLDQAARLARRAIQFVPDDAWALLTMATVLSARLDLVGARRKLEQAINIRPHLAAAKGELARVLVFSGQIKQGRILAAEAFDANPRDPHASLWLRSQAIASWMEGNYDHAVAMAELTIEKRSSWYPNYLIAAVAHVRAGNSTAARQAIETAKSMGAGDLTMDALRCGHPFEDRMMFDRFIADLRLAGWSSL